MTISEVPAGIQRLLDKDAIVELHDRFAAVLDAADWEALADLFTADAVLEGWSRSPGAVGRWEGLRTIVHEYREMSGVHQASQRMITNHRIALDGDRAQAAATYRSSHINQKDGELSAHAHEGWYLSELVRTPEGWRFAHVKHLTLENTVATTPGGLATTEEIYRATSRSSTTA